MCGLLVDNEWLVLCRLGCIFVLLCGCVLVCDLLRDDVWLVFVFFVFVCLCVVLLFRNVFVSLFVNYCAILYELSLFVCLCVFVYVCVLLCVLFVMYCVMLYGRFLLFLCLWVCLCVSFVMRLCVLIVV